MAKTGGGGNGADKQEEQKDNGLDARALALTKERQKIDQDMYEAAKELSKTVTELAGMSVKQDSLKRAVKSLEIAVKTLSKIKVVFDNTKAFWQGVEENCKEIVDNADTVEMVVEAEEKEMVIGGIAESALNWFVLGKICYTAKYAISQVDKGMDKIQSNLPNEAEAQKMIPNLLKEMQMVLGEEVKALEEKANPK